MGFLGVVVFFLGLTTFLVDVFSSSVVGKLLLSIVWLASEKCCSITLRAAYQADGMAPMLKSPDSKLSQKKTTIRNISRVTNRVRSGEEESERPVLFQL